ncbi:MAG: DUF3307 domain-containing protein [bacterium]|nr:DUF3307 domain-containing protein [bacterium]MDD5353732.1 DUF3307 domain-containing protein [bacterium]MDD5755894.1 DUF3307 domain-containing protein [bacterium]
MFVFWRLLLAHFIADFPIQTNKIYILKTKYPWGSFFHSGIFVISGALLLWPFWERADLWFFLLFLFISHGFQDLLKIIYNRKNSRDTVWLFLLDQILHIAFISTVFLLPLSLVIYTVDQSSWLYWYSQDKPVIYLTFLIGIGFGGSILIPYVEKLVKHLPQVEIPPQFKYYGILERILVITLVSAPGYWYIFTPVVFLVRYFSKEKYSAVSVLVSVLAAVVGGITLRVIF